jgi:sarcosine/dimethylglycine N-methyltransferase
MSSAQAGYQAVVQTARDYYNSDDADSFYATIWGGEDIHIGLYRSEDEDIHTASRRTVEQIASHLRGLGKDSYVLDVGSGYGGAARYLARRFGCRVVGLNLSEVENERARDMNRAQGLDDLIEIVDGSFEDLPYADATFDVAWSQDAILHSGRRERVIAEVARVLKPGGDFVFTDPMKADDCPDGVLTPILERIHLDTLGSPGFYQQAAARNGLTLIAFEDHGEQLPRHYGRVLAETERNEAALAGRVSPEYIARMKKGLGHWIEGGRQGHLAWGIFHFRKAA